MAERRVPVPSARPAPRPPRRRTPLPPPTPIPKPIERRPITPGSTLTVLLAGGSGTIGTELAAQLTAAGHTVQKLVRRPPKAPNEFSWAPDAKILDFRLLESVDAVVNLSGASLNRIPWTAKWKAEILRSRVKSTQALVEAMGMASSPPPVFLSGSASGYYGDRPGERLTESAPRGTGFLADVVEAWEHAALLAPEGTRTVLLRTGIVLSPTGGALQPLKLATRFGAGATIGPGTQVWPWISLHDEAAAIVHLLTSTVSGPVNLAGPRAATSAELTRRLAHDLHRPHLFTLPAPLLELGMGDAARELLLPSTNAVPAVLDADGFAFRDATVDAALAAALAKR